MHTQARKEMDHLVGRDLAAAFKGIEPASVERQAEVASWLHDQLLKQPEHLRDSFKLFGALDSDRSGRIQFDELCEFIRGDLSYQRGGPSREPNPFVASLHVTTGGYRPLGRAGHGQGHDLGAAAEGAVA
jgi:hypothetical protein